MTRSWPREFYIQLVFYVICLISGAFVLDGVHSNAIPIYLVSLIPPLVVMLSLNEPTLFLSNYTLSFTSNMDTVAITGMRIPLYEQEDLAEERYLKVHGDYLRRFKRLFFFWAQAVFSYGVLAIFDAPKGGGLSLVLAGLVMILSFGRGHLLLALVIQGLFILSQFQLISIATPIWLSIYLILFFSLLAMPIYSRTFLLRGVIAGVFFIILFLFVDWGLPGDAPKWSDELTKMAKNNFSGNKSNPAKVLSQLSLYNEELDNDGLMPQSLSFDQIMDQLDTFEQMLKQGQFSSASSDASFGSLEGNVAPSDLRAMSDLLKKIRSNKASYSKVQLESLEKRLLDLSSQFEKIAESNKGAASEWESFQSDLNQLKNDLSSSSKNLFKNYGDADSVSPQNNTHSEVLTKEKKAKEEAFFGKIWHLFQYLTGLLLLFFFYRIVRFIFKKKKIVSEHEEEIIQSIAKDYKKIRRLFKSREDEVIFTYQVVHKGMEKLYYLPSGQFAPPPEILANTFAYRQKSFQQLALLFSKVQYGKHPVSASELKLFRQSFKSVIRLSL